MANGGEYGARAVLGVGTPQANPTVEPEVGALMPAGVNLLTTRLTSPVQNSRDRLIDYMDRLEDALRAYDVLRLDAFGLACTGSSYLIGAAREAEIVAAAEQTFGYPVITSAMAVCDGLMHLGVKRVALISPYPDWLEQASIAYWEAAGIEIVDTVRIDTGDPDTRGPPRPFCWPALGCPRWARSATSNPEPALRRFRPISVSPGPCCAR